MSIRRALLLGHRWLGLLLGLVMLLLGVTGSILSFQREIDAALNPGLFRPSGPPNPEINYAAIQRIAEQATGRPVGSIRPPDAVWPVWVVSPPRQRGTPPGPIAYIDPANRPAARRARRPRELHRRDAAAARGAAAARLGRA